MPTRLRPHILIATALALVLGGGCTGQPAASGIAAKPTHNGAYVPGGTTFLPVPHPNETHNLRQTSPGPGTPTPAPTPTPTPPAVFAQTFSLAAQGSLPASNLLVVDAASDHPPQALTIKPTGSVGASTASAYALAAAGPHDPHAAFRAFEAAHLQAPPPAAANAYGLKSVATALKEGVVQKFYVITGFDANNYRDVQVSAQLVKAGAHCYIFVDKAWNADGSQDAAVMNSRVREIADAFDTGVYPTNTRLFGSEPNPGIDNDPHVVILLSPAVGNYGQDNTLGFFSQRDETRPSAELPAIYQHSNAREMLYVSSRIVMTGSQEDYMGTIAHEFQHMINFNQKVLVAKNRQSEDLWIDEGLAMYAIEANGYGLKSGGVVLTNHVKRFEQSPEDYSLTDWNKNPEGIGYGPVYLLMVYLADRFNESIIKEIVTNKETGLLNIDHRLAPHGATFDGVFHDWAAANLLSGRPQVANARYGYQSLATNGTNGKTTLPGFATKALLDDTTISPRPYSVHYYSLAAGKLPGIAFFPSTNTSVQPAQAMP